MYKQRIEYTISEIFHYFIDYIERNYYKHTSYSNDELFT